ncbi:MAG: molybdenum cofactor guanylyltransferase [Actinomycetota bacterium]
MERISFDAVVLAGGGARRLGGADKAELRVAGRRLIDRVLGALEGAERIVVVGPARVVDAPVLWTREEPVGAGPVAAVTAGLELVQAETVVLLAVDLPFVETATVERLVTAVGDGDGALLVDGEGRDQMLAGAYRAAALRARVAELGDTAGASMRGLIEGLSLARVVDERAATDCDTWDDVAAAEEG